MTVHALSYAFPPVPYARSVQVARLLSHLHSAEAVTVLHAEMGQEDPELLALVPSDRINATSLRQPPVMGRLLGHRFAVPDPYLPWARHAAGHFLRRRVTADDDVLVSFGHPMSDHLAGLRIARSRGVSWVAHFSDPWVQNPYVKRGAIAAALNRRYERAVMASADALVFTSDETRAATLGRYPGEWSSRAHVLPHAYDPELFPAPGRAVDPGRPLIARYLGNFYQQRGPEPLFEALACLPAVRPDLARELRVELVGTWLASYRPSDSFRSLPEGLVAIRGRVGYLESLRLMQEADLLLVIDAPSEQSLFLPSKLIEYIGAGKPILAISPPGPSASLVGELGGWVSAPGAAEQTAAHLADALDRLPQEPWGDPEVRQRFAAPSVGARFKEIIAQARERRSSRA